MSDLFYLVPILWITYWYWRDNMYNISSKCEYSPDPISVEQIQPDNMFLVSLALYPGGSRANQHEKGSKHMAKRTTSSHCVCVCVHVLATLSVRGNAMPVVCAEAQRRPLEPVERWHSFRFYYMFRCAFWAKNAKEAKCTEIHIKCTVHCFTADFVCWVEMFLIILWKIFQYCMNLIYSPTIAR